MIITTYVGIGIEFFERLPLFVGGNISSNTEGSIEIRDVWIIEGPAESSLVQSAWRFDLLVKNRSQVKVFW